MRVLVVVEDDPGMRLLVQETLSEDDRLEIDGEVATIEEAVEAARRHPPDLIILDHYLTGKVMGLNGAPLLKEAAPDARIILFTGHDLEVEASREPAIDAFLHKKNLDELLATIHKVLSIT
jgi:DNA-binding NarL/FixJ family response regulator